MNIPKLLKNDKCIILGAIVIALIFSVFQFVMFSEASTPNPGHSAAEIGSGTFGEVGNYIFPGASNVGIGVASPSYNLDVQGTGHFTNPVIAKYPDIGSHAATKEYVDSVCGGVTCIDNDGDGYGDPGDASCPNGEETDCDDNNILIYPGRTEICDNGVDDDCDTDTDCDDSECVGDPHCVVSCIDNDGDGYGVCPNCDIVNGCTHDGDDCCDSDANVYPGQTKYFSSINNCGNWDYDCSGKTEKKDCRGGCTINLINKVKGYSTRDCTGPLSDFATDCFTTSCSYSCGEEYDYCYCQSWHGSRDWGSICSLWKFYRLGEGTRTCKCR